MLNKLPDYCIGRKCDKYKVCISGYSPCKHNPENQLNGNIKPPKGGTGEVMPKTRRVENVW